jgi:predicted amidohydrolase
MRLLLGELAPVPGEVARNVATIEAVVRAEAADLAVFPELYLTAYRIGDRVHTLALRPDDAAWQALRRLAHECSCGIVVGTPLASTARPGEVENAVLLFDPSGAVVTQVKRYLPNFGPFEEAVPFTPTDTSRAYPFAGHRIGLQICYDVFFPEVSRELALDGAELLVAVSASPTTSRRLFEKLLPARAVENGVPLVYVNRVGVEDGFVFGGGSGVWDARGEPVALAPVERPSAVPEERLFRADLDLTAARRWRPFRPVLRDVAARRGSPP